jgi:probable F420-dependent oxidoreductase
MRYGVSTFATDEGMQPVALGKALEERGFDSVFLAEHTHIPVRHERPYPGGGQLPRRYHRTLDPFVTLGAIAAVTARILLATGVTLLAQRDPIITAKQVASLDLVSAGRAILGIGAGWNREEIRNHGTDPRLRGRLLDERMRAIIEIWTKDQAEFHGEFVDFGPIFCWPKPLQSPHPPIYVGGGSRRTFERVAEYGDAWLANGLPPRQLQPRLAELRQVAGREVPVTLYNATDEQETVAGYRRLGIERVLFYLPTLPEDEMLRFLDHLLDVVEAIS